MAAKLESRALMVDNSDSDSESGVTEFGPSKRKNRRRLSIFWKWQGVEHCLPLSLSTVALALSAVVNVVLFIVLLVIVTKSIPPDCLNIPPDFNRSGFLYHNTNSWPTSAPSPSSRWPGILSPTQSNSFSPGINPCLICGQHPHRVEPPVDDGYVNIFRDLSPQELSAAVQYLGQQLSLTNRPQTRHDSTIFQVELHVPTKDSALQFLDSSAEQPAREALVSVFLGEGASPSPVFRQYVVGPLPRPTYHKVNVRMSKDVPFSKLTHEGVAYAFPYLFIQLKPVEVQNLLNESFGALTECSEQRNETCLLFLTQKISFGLVNETTFIFTAYYKAEFPTIHPLPFQVLISVTETEQCTIRFVYYGGSTFSSLDDLVEQYKRGNIQKVSKRFPKNAPGENSTPGSMNLRGEPFPKMPHPPPRQFEPKGPRFSIVNQHVKYLKWSFNMRNSVESGPQLFDVRWSGKRIVYEISLQEIAVLYAGANPASMFAHLSDSAFGLGSNAKFLVPGVDCPEHASFLSTWVYGPFFPKELHNTLCVFEHNSGVPLRRHSAEPGYGGLVDHLLIVRTIIVEFNYDYIIDFVFHANGALETRVYATGYIMANWFHYGEDPFGFEVFKNVVGSVHHHLFHFKLDLDVGGVSNRYETLDFAVDDRDWPWLSTFKHSATSSNSSSSRSFQQISFKHNIRKSEKDALYLYNFSSPKYHIFYTDDNKNQFGNPRAYRLVTNGFSKQLLPETHTAVRSRKWTQYCMAVTKRKEEEAKSSTIFSMYDADDPVIDFDDYIQDNDDILDSDLVAWVTVGMHHIPHTEDIPNTPTVGTEAAILLLPFNYFLEDPSMGSRDAVRVEPRMSDGAPQWQTYGAENNFSCSPPPLINWLLPEGQGQTVTK